MDLCTRQRKVPVAREGFWRREGDVAVVDGSDSEENIAAKNDGSEPNYKFVSVMEGGRRY